MENYFLWNLTPYRMSFRVEKISGAIFFSHRREL